MSRDIDEKPQAVAESSKEGDLLAPEKAASSSKKERGQNLLPVPSSERDSISGQSKGSKGSVGTGPTTTTPGNSLPSSPAAATHGKKKKGGLFALFSCCGVPDHANGLDATEDHPHKVEKLAPRPTTASRRTLTPQDQPSGSKTQLYEKETQQQSAQAGTNHTKPDKRESGTSSHDHSTVGERDTESKQTTLVGNSTAPTVTVEPPNAAASSEPAEPTTTTVIEAEEPRSDVDSEGDVSMPDADAPAPKPTTAQTATGNADQPYTSLPPPPPGPVPAVPSPPTSHINETDVADQPPKFLLPPQAPEFKGKKCLVLDLDETLVHSSFKILHQADFTIPVEIEGNYHNVYVIKRPGVDQFMKRVGELYEVVVFTASVSKYGDPLLDQLDIHHVVHHRLFRESCYNHQGNYVKDLSQVGRDLKETIIIDNSPTSYIFHPQHAVPISSWFSDAHDNELLDLIPVLEDLAGSQVQDVSLVLDVTL